MKPKIAIACQGGGSQTAFTAGALKGLFEGGVQEHYEIVSISGTSGGAICAFLTWYALRKGESPVWKRLVAFWEANKARSAGERVFNDTIVKQIELIDQGILPQINLSPSSPFVQGLMATTTAGLRKEYTDLRRLLESYADFDEIASWEPGLEAPILFLGACNVLTGELRRFASSRDTIQVEQILASCAVPNIFEAVEIGKDAYWDGLFSDNPPVDPLIQRSFVGVKNLPDEIWVIKINPTTCDNIPTSHEEIADRRNELVGNVSLFQSLQKIEVVNELLLMGAFAKEFLAKVDRKEPFKIPRAGHVKEERLYHIPMIEMSEELQKTLSYVSKIDRSPENIDRLMQDGEKQGKAYLEAKLSIGRPKRG
jgi:NTE family protein